MNLTAFELDGKLYNLNRTGITFIDSDKSDEAFSNIKDILSVYFEVNEEPYKEELSNKFKLFYQDNSYQPKQFILSLDNQNNEPITANLDTLPITKEMFDRIQFLVKGVNVNINEPLKHE